MPNKESRAGIGCKDEEKLEKLREKSRGKKGKKKKKKLRWVQSSKLKTGVFCVGSKLTAQKDAMQIIFQEKKKRVILSLITGTAHRVGHQLFLAH